MDNLTIIDATSLIYSASYNNQVKGSDYFGDYKQSLDNYILNILSDTHADFYLLFTDQSSNTFRKIMYPDYKINRKKQYFQFSMDLNHYIEERWNAFKMEKLEADDLCLIHANELKNEYNITVAFKDKDLLQQEGRFFDYKCYRNNIDPSEAFIDLSKEQALYNLCYQLLNGDSVDGIKGLPKCGEQTSKLYLDKYGASLDNVRRAYLEGIDKDEIGARMSIAPNSNDNFYKTFNLVYLLKSTVEAGIRGAPLLLYNPIKFE